MSLIFPSCGHMYHRKVGVVTLDPKPSMMDYDDVFDRWASERSRLSQASSDTGSTRLRVSGQGLRVWGLTV